MAEKAKVPTYDKLMWPLLRALKSMGDSASHSELLEKAIEQEGIPEAIHSVPPTDGRQTKVSDNLWWSHAYHGKVCA